MSDSQTVVHTTIRSFLERADKAAEFDASTSLFADGLGLDSLETAELSAMLEDALGSDPFSAGIPAASVGEILAFYQA